MSTLSSRSILRCCRGASCSSSKLVARPSHTASLRTTRRRRSISTTSKRWASTASADASDTANANPKIAEIVDRISSLTLLETADLVSTLKTRLNIPDMPTFAPSAAPAANAAEAAAPAEEEEDAAPKMQEKTLFNLKLQSIDAAAKPKIIKEIKAMLGLSLVESKKFVESVPKVMKENSPKDECEKIIETMKALGGVVVME